MQFLQYIKQGDEIINIYLSHVAKSSILYSILGMINEESFMLTCCVCMCVCKDKYVFKLITEFRESNKQSLLSIYYKTMKCE